MNIVFSLSVKQWIDNILYLILIVWDYLYNYAKYVQNVGDLFPYTKFHTEDYTPNLSKTVIMLIFCLCPLACAIVIKIRAGQHPLPLLRDALCKRSHVFLQSWPDSGGVFRNFKPVTITYFTSDIMPADKLGNKGR